MSEQMNMEDLGFFMDEPGREKKESSGGEKKEFERNGVIYLASHVSNHGTSIIKHLYDKRKVKVLNKATNKYEEVDRLTRKVISPMIFTMIKSDKINEADPKPMDYNKYRLPNLSDYEESGVVLTQEQRDLYKKCRDFLWGLKGHYDFMNGRKEQQEGTNKEMRRCIKRLDFPGQVVLFYGKLVGKIVNGKEVTNDPDLNTVKVFCYDKGSVKDGLDFLSVLKKKVNERGALKKSFEWTKDYFNNNLGKNDKVMMVTLTRPRTYNIAISFESDIPYEITEKDLSFVGDLNEKYFKCTEFDEGIYREIEKVIDYMKQNVTITPLPEPEKKEESKEEK